MTAQKKFIAVNTVTAQLHPQFLLLYSILFLYNNYYYITVGGYWFIVLKSLAQYIVGKTLDFI